MLMKKWISYVVVLSTLIVLIFIIGRKRSNPYGKNNTSFAVEDIGDIARVEFIEGDSLLILQSD